MHESGLIVTIAIALAAALALGYITHRLGLSPIVGYLLAGIAVSPYTPGPVADTRIAPQLAEIGVVLLMFGVGLHFQWKDLRAVRAIAVPGAVVQSILTTLLTTAVAMGFGCRMGEAVILGAAISVASTVVLIRVLMDNNLLQTPAGHAAVGWLIVEDILTVVVLVLLPTIAGISRTDGAAPAGGGGGTLLPLLLALGKLLLLGVLMALVGKRVIPWLMERVARSKSRELFTLTVLVVALGIATASAELFGVSMALGAFLAGMAVAQSDVSHQAASDALPMRDAFAVLFFVSVGMLFDPRFLVNHPVLILSVLGIIVIGKSLIALAIVLLLGHPVRTALTVGLGMAQIGEFSFILAGQGWSLGILSDAGQNAIVAASLISITLNPFLFRYLPRMETWLQGRPAMWRFLNRRFHRRNGIPESPPPSGMEGVRAVVVGYGPVGRTLAHILEEFGIRPVIIEMNIDTVKKLLAEGSEAIYGDATRRDILEAAKVHQAEYLLVTLPDLPTQLSVIAAARQINRDIRIFARTRYLGQRNILKDHGVLAVAYEEAEVAVALAAFLFRQIGLKDEDIAGKTARIRDELGISE